MRAIPFLAGGGVVDSGAAACVCRPHEGRQTAITASKTIGGDFDDIVAVVSAPMIPFRRTLSLFTVDSTG